MLCVSLHYTLLLWTFGRQSLTMFEEHYWLDYKALFWLRKTVCCMFIIFNLSMRLYGCHTGKWGVNGGRPACHRRHLGRTLTLADIISGGMSMRLNGSIKRTRSAVWHTDTRTQGAIPPTVPSPHLFSARYLHNEMHCYLCVIRDCRIWKWMLVSCVDL